MAHMGRVRPEVSVIIPVLNEGENIGACLEAVWSQDAGSPFEIIVVDGGSRDGTARIAKSLGALVLDNPGRTAAAGRNIGVSAARGRIVAFTDGDCIPSSDWLKALDEAFEDPSVDGVAGRVVPYPSENECERFWGHLAWEVIMPFGEEGFRIDKRSLGASLVTASCAYRRDALDDLGGFDEWFGNNAEDVDLTWRALDAGKRLLYDPAALVYARGPRTVGGIQRKGFRNGLSSSKLQKRYGGMLNLDPDIYRQLAGSLRRGRQNALMRRELAFHLLGKYYGSLRYGVINL